MALEYTDNEKFEALAPVLEDYTHWFSLIAFAVAYPEQEDLDLTPPDSFNSWLEKVSKKGDVSSSVLNDLAENHDKMGVAADKVIMVTSKNTKPEVKVFMEFKDLYSSFLSRIRRLEKDSALEGSGVCEETGLRIPKAIKADMKREKERLTRQGTPFSIVLARIDKFAGQTDQKQALKVTVNSIEESMRPFDDAYYMGNGHFLLSLKQADIIGADAAISRLRLQLDSDLDNVANITMSYCLAEPSDADEYDELIKSMQQDLNDHINAKDAVLKFKEMSALERFMGTRN